MRLNNKLFMITASLVSILTGCGNTPVDSGKFNIVFGDKTLTSYTELESEEDLKSMIERKENFILVFANVTCSCWGTFKDRVVNPFVNETSTPIYMLNIDRLGSEKYGMPLDSKKSNTPVLGLFNEGKYSVGVAYSSSNKLFSSLDIFKNYINQYVILPSINYISLADFNNKLKGDSPFIVYYSWERCDDCLIFSNSFLKDYLKTVKSTKAMPFYVVETQTEGLRLNDGVFDSVSWQAKKDYYGLSETFNKTTGYGLGYVPTLHIINPSPLGDNPTSISSLISDGLVYNNESVSKNETGEYYIKTSYYDGVRGKDTYLGNYQSEIGKIVDEKQYDITQSSSGGYRFDKAARKGLQDLYAAKFLDYYWANR